MRKTCQAIKMFVAIAIVIAWAALPASAEEASGGGTYFLKTNIWYEKPNDIPSTNYHKGAMLPVGTMVTGVHDNGYDAVKFSTESGTFKIFFIKKHSAKDTTLTDIFNQYFTRENPLKSSAYEKFTDLEKKNIKRGEVVEGMSKEAVLMAYGTPPSHVTPSLQADTWTFWKSRFDKVVVVFENNQVIKTTN